MVLGGRDKNERGLRVIKTARDLESINMAAKSGLRPLVKKVQPSDEIRSSFWVVQHKETGEILVIGDCRWFDDNLRENVFETVIDRSWYYPYNFKSPFAAYLVPRDIKVGERVFIEDLIEDYIDVYESQGSKFRLESCEAVWNGSDFVIQYSGPSQLWMG